MEILGVRVDNVTYQEALEKAKKLIESGGKHYIVTPNPEIVVAAQKDRRFKEILNKSSLSIPDGIGLVWGARVLGKNLPERVTGTDLLEGLAALAAEHGFSLFLLGGGEGVAEKAAARLKTRYPTLKIAGTYAGESSSASDTFARRRLAKLKIDILAVAFGAPRQERWIARNLPHLNVRLAIGVGGALDYISGEKPRAPIWLQKVGLEWLFRLIKEPSRLKRQLSLPYFSYLVFKEKFRKI